MSFPSDCSLSACLRGVFCAVGLFLFTATLPGQVTVDPVPLLSESFTGTTAADWTFVTGQGTGSVLTAAQGIDADGSGWLRLTGDIQNQSSFVYHNQALPTQHGLIIRFDFVIWGAANSLGDGFTLALFDASVTPEAGGYGGSLGYAQRFGQGGLAGGIVGFGFDVHGNFSAESEGRVGGPGRTQNAIAIRGSMGETRAQGYDYITGTGSLDAFSKAAATERGQATIHTVRLTLSPSQEITVEWQRAGDLDWIVLIDQFQCDLVCPESVRLGFTAGTGQVSAHQEIRNLEVAAIPEPRKAAFAMAVLAALWVCRRKMKSGSVSETC
ncbi:MAG: hypothetical protein JJT96_08940 [Opitutales bacterium]|nr:hypothetical protein [Opitutales bacterium]